MSGFAVVAREGFVAASKLKKWVRQAISAAHVAAGERWTHDLVLPAEACRLVYGRPATRRARARIS